MFFRLYTLHYNHNKHKTLVNGTRTISQLNVPQKIGIKTRIVNKECGKLFLCRVGDTTFSVLPPASRPPLQLYPYKVSTTSSLHELLEEERRRTNLNLRSTEVFVTWGPSTCRTDFHDTQFSFGGRPHKDSFRELQS